MKTSIIPAIKELRVSGAVINISDYSLTDMFKEYIPVWEDIFSDFDVKLGGEKPLSFTVDPSLGKEEYRISASADSISVVCSDPAGAYYALVSIAQLAALNGGELAEFTAHDLPDKDLRAYSDDISRGQISTLENFKDIIRRCSYYKYNVYMPYIEDTIAVPGLPDFGKYSDPVPVKEWQEMVAYGRSYGISVRPIINLLGHWHKNCMLRDFRKYMLMKTNKDGTEVPTSVLDPRKPQTRKLILKLLDTTVEAFGQGIIHVGGDEPFELKDVLGIEEATRLYVEHFNWLNGEVKKRGCKMMIYADMFTDIWSGTHASFDSIKGLDSDIGFVYWNYDIKDDLKDIKDLAESGLEFYVSPSTLSFARFFPALGCAYDNCRLLAKQGAGNSSGIIISSWNDGGTLLREENTVAIAMAGEFSWNCESKRTLKDLLESFLTLFYGFEEPDVKPFLEFYDFERRFKDVDDLHRPGISGTLHNEFWKDPRRATESRFDLGKNCSKMFSALCDAQEEIEELKPKRNKIAFDCFKFDVSRMLWACMRSFVIPAGPFADREEARSIVDDLIVMGEEYSKFKRENKRLWMKTNRQSEWNFVESRYIDNEHAIDSLIRYCKFTTHLSKDKFIIKRF